MPCQLHIYQVHVLPTCKLSDRLGKGYWTATLVNVVLCQVQADNGTIIIL